MAHDVFISHSTKDKAISDAACAALEGAGIRCWIAPRDVQPGRSFAGEINRAIQHSKVMVLIFSAHSNNSEQVLREVQLAVNSHLHIIQFRIEDVRLNDDLEYFLSTPHWLDALTQPLESHIERLATSIKALLGTEEMTKDERTPSHLPQEVEKITSKSQQPSLQSHIVRQPKKRMLLLAVAAALSLLVAGWHFGIGLRFKKDSTSSEPRISQTEKSSTPVVAPAPSESAVHVPSKTIKATKEQPFVNSLGMKFVPVPGTDVLFSIWDTRVQDYEVFVKATGRSWEKPYGFLQGPSHPVVDVSWEDAKAFCQWLTEMERTAGTLGAEQEYRLPTDAEWSVAAGLSQESGATLSEKEEDGRFKGVYPWGKQWPPPKGAGNYHASLDVDDYEKTSPVGSFGANTFGLYDMGGNVHQWCEDWFNTEKKLRVLRGSSWLADRPFSLLSSYRVIHPPTARQVDDGFRVVVGSSSAR